MFIRKIYLLAISWLMVFCTAEKVQADDHIADIEGLVKKVSKLADPKKSDYPDCYYIVEFEVKNIISGVITSRIINLSVPGFMNYKLTPYHRFKAGDKIRCQVVLSDHATAKERSTQSCDDFNEFEFDTYFLRSGKLIHEWSTLPPPQFINKEKYVSIWSRPLNPPQDPESVKARAAAIRRDLERLENKSAFTVSSDHLQKRWEKESSDLTLYKKYYRWFQVGKGVFALPKNIKYYANYPVTPQIMEAINSFTALNKYLRKQNVDLILVLYPDCFSVALRAFFKDIPDMPVRPNEQITRMLLANDVEVIDLAPHLEPLFASSEFLFYYYHLNQHPGWETQDVAGRLVAERLTRYNIAPGLKPELFAEKRVLAMSENYVYPDNLPIGGHKPGTPVTTYATFYNKLPSPDNADSPVLLWGNSFLDWPKNKAFMTAVAKYHLNFCSRRHGAGCFTSMFRDLLLCPQQYLQGKKVMVIPVAVTMMRDRKIWNIEKMEEQLMLQNKIAVSINVPLPPGGSIPQDIAELFKAYNVKGNYYSLNNSSLQVELPEFERKEGVAYYLKITCCNWLPINCRYAGKVYPIAAPAQFTLETLTIPYDPAKNEIMFFNEHGRSNFLISDIKIEGYEK